MDEKYWDRVARDYDGEIFDSLASDRNGVMLSRLDEFSNARGTAFDVGCGVGKYIPALARRFGIVHAADLSAECVRRAKAAYGHLKNVSIAKGDLSRKMVSTGKGEKARKADFILCANVLIMPSDKMRAGILKRLSGMLKPGGGLLLLVPSLESSLYAHARRIEWLRRSPGLRVPAATTLPPGRGVLRGLLSIDGVPTKHWLREELVAMLAAAGFRSVAVDKVEYDWKTEFHGPPGWMKAPYPWDWAVAGVKKN